MFYSTIGLQYTYQLHNNTKDTCDKVINETRQIYVYSNGSEKHICCEDGLISEVPVFIALPSVTAPTHLPKDNRRFLFVKDGDLYFYDKDKVATKVTRNTNVEFAINNW